MDRHHQTGIFHPPDNGAVQPAPDWEPPAATGDPQLLAQWTEIHAAIDQLPEQEREVCDLFWYQGFTQREIAETLGLSVETVKRRWRAARLRLARLVGQTNADLLTRARPDDERPPG